MARLHKLYDPSDTPMRHAHWKKGFASLPRGWVVVFTARYDTQAAQELKYVPEGENPGRLKLPTRDEAIQVLNAINRRADQLKSANRKNTTD